MPNIADERPPRGIISDIDLLDIFEKTVSEADVPSVSVRDALLSPLRAQASPFLDKLYADSLQQSENALSAEVLTVRKLKRIAEARQGESLVPLVSATARAEPMVRLMKENYPPRLHDAARVECVDKFLQYKGADALSFLVLDREEQYSAMCRANVGHMYATDTSVIRLHHLVVNSSQRHSLLGIRVLREFLYRAKELPEDVIELIAREETSYKAFKVGSFLVKAWNNAGYEIESNEWAKPKHSENLYCIQLTRTDKPDLL